MASLPKTCGDCNATLCATNQGGYCRRHTGPRVMQRPEVRAKVSRSRRLMFMADPERREGQVQRMLAARACVVHRGRNLIGGELSRRGNANRPAGSESRMQAGKRAQATKLAWCPPELRETYRFLMRKKRLTLAEAKAVIESQHQIEMRRWRQSIGAETAEPIVIAPNDDLAFFRRASVIAARAASVGDLWAPNKDKPAVRARWTVFMALTRAGWSQSRIGRQTGMDRKTVSHGLKQAERLLIASPEFAELYRRVASA